MEWGGKKPMYSKQGSDFKYNDGDRYKAKRIEKDISC